jgi:hypothetical protein
MREAPSKCIKVMNGPPQAGHYALSKRSIKIEPSRLKLAEESPGMTIPALPDFPELPSTLYEYYQLGDIKRLRKAPIDAVTAALRARRRGTTEFREVALFLVDLARHYLPHVIAVDSVLSVVDNAITSNLLAWFAYSGPLEERDASYYFKLSYSLTCFAHARELQLSYPLPFSELETEITFFFIRDCANAWVIRNGGIPPRLTTFNQRVQYFDSFVPSHFFSNADEPQYPSLLESANSTLGNLMEVALTWTSRFSKSEITGAVDRAQLDQVLLYIRSELGDPDLHAALQVLHKSFQGPNTNHTTVEGQLITCLFHRLRSILFLHAVLSAPSILEGFQHLDVSTFVTSKSFDAAGLLRITFCCRGTISVICCSGGLDSILGIVLGRVWMLIDGAN